MATTMTFRVNVTANDDNYQTDASDFLTVNLTNDYLVWSAGDATYVKDLATAEPSAAQLNNAATQISDSADVTVDKCFIMDYSHDFGGAYYLHEINNMGENKQYVFCFSFDGDTASEPQLEAWDDSGHDSTDLHILGNGTPASSMLKGVCTTSGLPGASWAGAAIAGSSNVLLLNDGNGALAALGSGESSQELYANLKIVIPQSYATPAAETFILTCRHTWN